MCRAWNGIYCHLSQGASFPHRSDLIRIIFVVSIACRSEGTLTHSFKRNFSDHRAELWYWIVRSNFFSILPGDPSFPLLTLLLVSLWWQWGLVWEPQTSYLLDPPGPGAPEPRSLGSTLPGATLCVNRADTEFGWFLLFPGGERPDAASPGRAVWFSVDCVSPAQEAFTSH